MFDYYYIRDLQETVKLLCKRGISLQNQMAIASKSLSPKLPKSGFQVIKKLSRRGLRRWIHSMRTVFGFYFLIHLFRMAVVGKNERDSGGDEGAEKSGICFNSVLILLFYIIYEYLLWISLTVCC